MRFSSRCVAMLWPMALISFPPTVTAVELLASSLEVGEANDNITKATTSSRQQLRRDHRLNDDTTITTNRRHLSLLPTLEGKFVRACSYSSNRGCNPYTRLGYSIGISGDASTIVAGGPWYDNQYAGTGYAVAYGYNPTTGNWTRKGNEMYESDVSRAGEAVAIKGNIILMSTRHDTGKITEYEYVNNIEWVKINDVFWSPGTSIWFGTHIAMSDDGNRFITTGRDAANNHNYFVAIYQRDSSSSSGWTQIGGKTTSGPVSASCQDDLECDHVFEFFGYGVSMDGSGNRIVVRYINGQSKVYEFDDTTQNWNQLGDIPMLGDNVYTYFTISGDGTTIAVFGTKVYIHPDFYDQLKVFRYNLNTNLWEPLGSEPYIWDAQMSQNGYGAYKTNMALTWNGERIVFITRGNDEWDVGFHVKDYDSISDSWIETYEPYEERYYEGPYSVDMSPDGDCVAIGRRPPHIICGYGSVGGYPGGGSGGGGGGGDSPSDQPSLYPSNVPTISPYPSGMPSDSPSTSQAPSDIPTNIPSMVPSFVPSGIPSFVPTAPPSYSVYGACMNQILTSCPCEAAETLGQYMSCINAEVNDCPGLPNNQKQKLRSGYGCMLYECIARNHPGVGGGGNIFNN